MGDDAIVEMGEDFDAVIAENERLETALREATWFVNYVREMGGETDIAEARRWLAEWQAKDGNSPGYSAQKARTYGALAAEWKGRYERLRRVVERTMGCVDEFFGTVALGDCLCGACNEHFGHVQDELDAVPKVCSECRRPPGDHAANECPTGVLVCESPQLQSG